MSKSKELVVDYRRKKTVTQPIFIKGEEVMVVSDYKYLGAHLSSRLDWRTNSEAVYKKGMTSLWLRE